MSTIARSRISPATSHRSFADRFGRTPHRAGDHVRPRRTACAGNGRAGAYRLRRMDRPRLRGRAVDLPELVVSSAGHRRGLRAAWEALRWTPSPGSSRGATSGSASSQASRSIFSATGPTSITASPPTSSTGRSWRCVISPRRWRGTRSVRRLAAGEIVTTGTLTRAFPVAAGEEWTTKLTGVPLEDARIRFV